MAVIAISAACPFAEFQYGRYNSAVNWYASLLRQCAPLFNMRVFSWTPIAVQKMPCSRSRVALAVREESDNSMNELPELRCPSCGDSRDVCVSWKRVLLIDALMRLLDKSPYSCRACGARFYAPTRIWFE